jgi:saccharopine dehydrogenase (NAD+, L-lysine-forming)
MVARHALLFGLDYLDIQLGARKLATLHMLEYEIAKAGRCFITEAGFHPGLPAALVRFAAGHFDRIESANIACYLSIDKDIPYTDSVEELVDVFRNYQAQIFSAGRWTRPAAFQMRKMAFGGDIGTRDSYSFYLEEMGSLPDHYPSLRETGFFMAGGHWFTDWVVYPSAIAALKLFPAAKRPVGRYLWWGMRRFQKAPYRTEIIVQARGQHAGHATRFEAAVSHRDAYELTAIPVVAALLQYLEGFGRKPGLWMMGHLADPRRLFTDMKRMGVKLRTVTD